MSINSVLSGLLIFLVVLLVLLAYRLHRLSIQYDLNKVQPENLPYILKGMLRSVEANSRWHEVEMMRYEVRTALSTLDRIRHDRNNKKLVADKLKSNQI